MSERLTQDDLSNLKKFFNLELNDLTEEKLKEARKEARKKYHPDNFSKFDDAIVQEMARERFQQIEILSKKLEEYLIHRKDFEEKAGMLEDDQPSNALYATEGIRIDIMTSDNTLKYHLFSSRVIYKGDWTRIKGTNAKIYSISDHSSRAAMGFRETIKVLLTFEETDSVNDIVHWFFTHISGRTTSFVIEGRVVKIDPYEIRKAIQKHSILELGSGE